MITMMKRTLLGCSQTHGLFWGMNYTTARLQHLILKRYLKWGPIFWELAGKFKKFWVGIPVKNATILNIDMEDHEQG